MAKYFEDDALAITIRGPSFIYFLLKDEKVVYVGQTKTGISRPYKHQLKDFDCVKIIPCRPAQLDELEDKYIKKYEPPLNKAPNMQMNYSIARIKSQYIMRTGDKTNLWHIKRAMRELGIQPHNYYGVDYVNREECAKICKFIENER